MQLRHLRYFLRIVDAGSFSRAAATIHVAQPALSLQIAELEEELGVTLLHRSARGVRPTTAGEALYREAAFIIQRMEQIPGKVRSSCGEIQGAVNLGMNSTLASFLAGPFMDACRTALPRVPLRFITGHSLLIASRMEARTLDLGVVFEDETEEMPGFLRQRLFHQSLFLIGHGLPIGGRTEISLAEVAQLPLVLPAYPNVARRVIDHAFNVAGLLANVAAEADAMFSLLSAVQSGLGSTIIPKGDLSDIPGYEKVRPLPIQPPIYLTASILIQRDEPLTSAAEAVRDLFTRFVARHLTESPRAGAEWIGAIPNGDSGIST
jgi:LysR family nitrogen assimilation transcriptional regulator